MYKKEFIGLYISGISEKVKSYCPMYHIYYDTLLSFYIWRALVADKTHFRQILSTGMIYSNA